MFLTTNEREFAQTDRSTDFIGTTNEHELARITSTTDYADFPDWLTQRFQP